MMIPLESLPKLTEKSQKEDLFLALKRSSHHNEMCTKVIHLCTL